MLRDAPAIAQRPALGLLERARRVSRGAREQAGAGAPEEFVLVDLHDALAALDEIVGKRSPDDVLRDNLRRFCIGK